MHEGARIVHINARLAEVFDYRPDELDGQSLEALLPERFRASHVGRRRGFFADPHVRPMGLGLELDARRKDGTEFPVVINLSYIRRLLMRGVSPRPPRFGSLALSMGVEGVNLDMLPSPR